jgi:hemerythrin
MVLYTKEHFQCEIQYLIDTNVSSEEKEKHNKEHDDFLKRLLDKIHDDINGQQLLYNKN